MSAFDQNSEVADPSLQVNSDAQSQAFTLKAILLGFIGVVIINAVAGFNDEHVKSTLLVGNHFPVSVYFFVLILITIWNPIASLISRYLVLSTREMTVTLGMMLIGCWTATSGFYRYFHRQLILPWLKLLGKDQWQHYGILENLPAKLFPLGNEVSANMDGKPYSEALKNHPLYDTVYTGFNNGLVKGKDFLSPFSDQLCLPPVGADGKPIYDLSIWDAWLQPMVYWAPLMICFSVAVLALVLLVHRQWAHHEQLSYPLASISSAIIDRGMGRRLPDIFYSRLFQWGVGFVLFIHLINLLSVWFPEAVPAIKLGWGTNWTTLFPSIGKAGGQAWGVNSGRVLFTIVGVTYFLSSEIGLTMGICNILLLVFLCQFYLATGKPFGGEALELTQAGSYIGYAVVLIYAGRTYYWSVLKKAFLFIGDDNEHERDSVLAARVLLVSFAAFVSVLYWMGLEPVVGVIYGLFVLLMFLVFTRIVCETGIPFLQTVWQPSFLLPKILGLSAIGVGPISFIYWMGSILHQDTRECMMPYVATSLKVADDNNVGLRRILVLGLAAVVLAFAVGFIAQARNIYNYGAAEDSYSYDTVAIAPFDRVARDVETMTNYNLIEDSNEASGLGKLKLVKFDGSVISLVLLGAGAVIVFSIMRFRFTWFPLHPVLFLVWNTYPLNGCMYSFLIGWAIKEIIVRFGGGKVYQQLKPLFIGLIVGEVIAACSGIIVGLIYFAVTDQMPKRFGILPG